MIAKNIYRLLLGAMLAACLFGCDVYWSRYSNKEYGFSILLPRFWQRQEGVQNTVVMSLSPVEGQGDKFRENINVMSGELGKEAPLDIVFEFNKQQIMQSLPGFKYDVSEGEIFAGREKGKWLMFNNKAEGVTLSIITAVWEKGKRVYVVTGICDTRELSKYDPTFRRALRSLRLK
jgi:hypothetical protein